MARLYSTRFALGTAGPDSDITYEVPAGNVAILRQVDAISADGTAGLVGVAIGSNTAIGVTMSVDAGGSIASGSWSGRCVAFEGETLTWYATINVDLQATGYLLTL